MSADATQGATPHNSLKRNTMVNLLGALAPMAVSLLTLPPYLRVIGDVRFGVLTLVWIFFGYFLFFDLGLGRAMAHHVAKAREGGDTRKLFWTGVLLNGSLGVVGGALLWGCSALLMGTVVKVPPKYLGEVRGALTWLALAMPLATAGSVLNGCLEGRERFVTLNLLGVIGAVLSQVAPLAIAIAYGPGLGGRDRRPRPQHRAGGTRMSQELAYLCWDSRRSTARRPDSCSDSADGSRFPA